MHVFPCFNCLSNFDIAKKGLMMFPLLVVCCLGSVFIQFYWIFEMNLADEINWIF